MAAERESRRRRGPQLEAALLEAAWDELIEVGFAVLTMESVAARAHTGVAVLYRRWANKDELVLAFLRQREQEWTRSWLEATVMARATEPEARLLAIFDVFHEWFQTDDFEGCSFINVLLQSPQASVIREAAAGHLAEIRTILARLAGEAGLAEPDRFARTWHFLMKGCIVTAQEGHRSAALEAQQAGQLILDSWSRQ